MSAIRMLSLLSRPSLGEPRVELMTSIGMEIISAAFNSLSQKMHKAGSPREADPEEG